MPRKRLRTKSRLFDPTEAELWWLQGRPFPPMVPSIYRKVLGFRGSDGDEFHAHGLNPLTVLGGDLKDMDRLRRLYEAAPDEVRARVPEIRRKRIYGEASAAEIAADQAKTAKRQRETKWRDPFFTALFAMDEKELDLRYELYPLKRLSITEKDRARVRKLEAELAALKAAK